MTRAVALVAATTLVGGATEPGIVLGAHHIGEERIRGELVHDLIQTD